MKLRQLFVSASFLGLILPTFATIIVQDQDDNANVSLSLYSRRMSGIEIIFPEPSASNSPQVRQNMQHAHAWSAYNSQNEKSGRPLVFGGSVVVKDRPSAARANLSRAQAFRLNYYKQQ